MGERVASGNGTGALGAEVATGERLRLPDAVDTRIEGHAPNRGSFEEKQTHVAEPESVAQRRADRAPLGRERHGCHVQCPAKHAGVPAGWNVGGDPVSRHGGLAAWMARRAKSREEDAHTKSDSDYSHIRHYGSGASRGPA